MNGKTGTLFIAATPIGNLDDMGRRAVGELSRVSLILAEDTRHAAKLLNHYKIKAKTRSFHEHNEIRQIPGIIDLLKNGSDIALICDAGTPLISDPGYRLVRAARENRLTVSPIPGPSAIIAALSASGLPTNRFCFEGFLSAKQGLRMQRLKALSAETRTLVFYESSHRIAAMLADMARCFPKTTKITVAREISKKFEAFYYGDIRHVLDIIEENDDHKKGEFVVVAHIEAAAEPDRENAEKLLQALLAYMPAKTAAKIVGDTFRISKNQLYGQALSLKSRRTRK